MLTLKQLIEGAKKLRGTLNSVPVRHYKMRLHKSVFSASSKLISQDSGHTYFPSIEWYVDTADKKKSSFARGKTKSGKVVYMKLPRINKNKCRVRCNCSDFVYTYAMTLATKGSLKGDLISFPKKPKGTGKPRNPKHIPGICKHIAGLVIRLKKDSKLK